MPSILIWLSKSQEYVWGRGRRLIIKCTKPSVKSFVIDSEAVAYDLETKKLLPFQDLSRRKRKDVRTEDITVRVHLFAFDLLYLNGEVSNRLGMCAVSDPVKSLLNLELAERRALLLEHFQPVEGEFAFATSSDGTTVDEIQAFLELSVKDGCEGLMVKMLKTPASTYEPSRRSQNWLKVGLHRARIDANRYRSKRTTCLALETLWT